MKPKFTSVKPYGYRTDLNGLRGLACSLVILNHLQVPGFSGGFIGVDIFFVLSGYLITGMLLRISSNNCSSIWVKYFIFLKKRAQRIFPASLIIAVIILLVTSPFLNYLYNRNNRIDAVYNSLMGGNHRFASRDTNYFLNDGLPSYFLHYWSLSVEWQFYLVFGLLVLIIRKRTNNDRSLRIFLGFLLFLSLTFFFLQFNKQAIYFSTFARSWEMLAGALVFTAKKKTRIKKKLSRYFAWDIIWISILLGVVFFVNSTNWHIGVFFTVLLTIALLSRLCDFKVLNYLLNFGLIQYLGTISFSLYLIHWPIILIVNSSLPYGNSKRAIISAGLTFVLSVLAFKVLERPFLSSNSKDLKGLDIFSLRKFSLFLNIALSLVFLIQILFISTFGVQSKFISQIFAAEKLEISNNQSTNGTFNLNDWETEIRQGIALQSLPPDISPNLSSLDEEGYPSIFKVDCLNGLNIESQGCTLGSASEFAKNLVVLGDSHAYSLIPALMRVFDLKKWKITLIAKANCQFSSESLDGRTTECSAHRDRVFNLLNKMPSDLILIHDSGTKSNIFTWRRSFLKAVAKLPTDIPIVYVSWLPSLGDIYSCLGADSLSISKCLTRVQPFLENYKLVAKDSFNNRNVLILDPKDWICIKNVCPIVIKSKLITVDGGHLTPAFAEILAPRLKMDLEKFLIRNSLS